MHARVYATRDEAALDLFEYIEVIYNWARMHTTLGDLGPAEFEKANRQDDESHPKAAQKASTESGQIRIHGHGRPRASLVSRFPRVPGCGRLRGGRSPHLLLLLDSM